MTPNEDKNDDHLIWLAENEAYSDALDYAYERFKGLTLPTLPRASLLRKPSWLERILQKLL